jgi:hypothetical protein
MGAGGSIAFRTYLCPLKRKRANPDPEISEDRSHGDRARIVGREIGGCGAGMGPAALVPCTRRLFLGPPELGAGGGYRVAVEAPFC